MKKIILCATVVASTVFGVMKATEVNNNNMSDIQLKNVELLAEGENDGVSCRWVQTKGKCKHDGEEYCNMTTRTFWGCREW